MSAIAEEGHRPRSDWSRRYPPLISVLVALLIALLVLPSALNIPQSNPTQTEEYAPVPPSEKSPPKGNTSALGLGNDATISENTPPPPPAGQQLLPPGVNGNLLTGKTPTTKQCVRDAKGVLRQTDDPLSPPCVAYFAGDNFGSTYQGVTRDEIRILVYLQGDFTYTNECSQANEHTGSGQYYDLALPPQGFETCDITGLRVWQTYFNTRYQTYGRFVHIFAYYGPQADSPVARRADAADNFQRIHPFAVISYAQSFEDDYLKAMAQYHVLNFGAFSGRDNAFFQQFPGLIWGYAPSVEQQAANYSSFVCQKMVGKPVSFSDAAFNGKRRKYGLIYTTDPGHPELREFKDNVLKLITACGVKIDAYATFPTTDFTIDPSQSQSTYAATNMARFKGDGITTIIWAGGVEINQSAAANNIAYYPEWLVAGDGNWSDGNATQERQDQTEWAHAWDVTYVPYVPIPAQTVCYQSFKSVDPSQANNHEIDQACVVYDNLRQVFTGIQVAGPRLGPTSINQGFHAIPAQSSFDPRVPACYYEANDYTCVKDGLAEWWDSKSSPPGGSDTPGCWRAASRGLRYLSNQWPAGDVLTMKSPADVCSDFGTGIQFKA